MWKKTLRSDSRSLPEGDRPPLSSPATRPQAGRLRRVLWRALQVPFALALLAILSFAVAVYAFPYPIEDLSPDAGGPLVITDRSGVVLRRVPAQDGRPGRESWVPLERVPSHAILTLLASEDERFFSHSGVDIFGILRAAWLNIREGRVGYGGSTITMQLVRMSRWPDAPRTFSRKIQEIVLALRLERAADKRFILEQYLNRAYYGNGAYGIEAAAQTYFGKPAASLSVGEATLLTVIPRSPVRYDPLKNLDAALARREHIFSLLIKKGLLSAEEAKRARDQKLTIAYHPPTFLAPHFTEWVLESLPQEVRARGGVLRTSLDLRIQERLEARVREHVSEMKARNMHQAGAVILDTLSGEVLALVGSADFYGKDGQVNIITRRRHPGSALKPFVYALAIEEGRSPASIAYDVADVPSEYRIDKLTQPERGPVRYREALAGSYNLAAVHVLEEVGVEKLLGVLARAGIELPGAPSDYGLRLALGSAKVRLLDLAAAYGFLVRDGKVTPPRAILEVVYADGSRWRPAPPQEKQLFSPEVSWLVMDMLSDSEARRPAFGQELPVDLPFPVAVKTGTARGFSDTVAIGVTREFTVAAWGGNFDGAPTEGLVAMQTAAPLVRAGLFLAGDGPKLTLPPRPSGVRARDVCPLSGQLPSGACPHRKREYFVSGKEPRTTCSWHRVEDGRLVTRFPPELRAWAQRNNLLSSAETDFRPPLTISD